MSTIAQDAKKGDEVRAKEKKKGESQDKSQDAA